MDRASALYEIRLEIKQIIENYEQSLRQLRGYCESGRIRNPEVINQSKLLTKYAKMIYGLAIASIDQLLTEIK
jgi:hypothetical protein